MSLWSVSPAHDCRNIISEEADGNLTRPFPRASPPEGPQGAERHQDAERPKRGGPRRAVSQPQGAGQECSRHAGRMRCTDTARGGRKPGRLGGSRTRRDRTSERHWLRSNDGSRDRHPRREPRARHGRDRCRRGNRDVCPAGMRDGNACPRSGAQAGSGARSCRRRVNATCRRLRFGFRLRLGPGRRHRHDPERIHVQVALPHPHVQVGARR
jgi:hypothetical protein